MDAVPRAGRSLGPDQSEPRATPYTRHTTDDRDEAERIIADLFLPNGSTSPGVPHAWAWRSPASASEHSPSAA